MGVLTRIGISSELLSLLPLIDCDWLGSIYGEVEMLDRSFVSVKSSKGIDDSYFFSLPSSHEGSLGFPTLLRPGCLAIFLQDAGTYRAFLVDSNCHLFWKWLVLDFL